VGTLSSSPRTLRGAIVAVDPKSPLSRIVIFQYNPDEVRRTLAPAAGDSGSGSGEVHHGWGAPAESVTMTVELDAADQLDAGDPIAGTVGILPQLSVLEMLLHPGSIDVIANTILLAAGTIEILPIELPLAVLVWGPARVVPVQLTGLTITEQAFNPGLAPVRASVEIAAKVLTYDDLSVTDVGYGLYVAHLVAKEVLAVIGAGTGAVGAVSDLVA
jgi:hypothetical protein